MSERQSAAKKEGTGEKGLRFLRDFNLFVGAAALGGAVLLPPLAAPLTVYGAFNVAQAGGFEVAHRAAKKHRKKSPE
jgi:hypothetical protein